MKYIVTLSLVFLMCSCAKEKRTPFQLPENASYLIAGDSVKTWKLARRYNGKMRMNMGECFLGYRQSFRESGYVTDNNAQMRDCGPSLEASWTLTTAENGHSYIKLTSDQIPELLGQESDEKLFKILYLDADSLSISFKHKQYVKERIVTDYLVREDLDIGDRNFHW